MGANQRWGEGAAPRLFATGLALLRRIPAHSRDFPPFLASLSTTAIEGSPSGSFCSITHGQIEGHHAHEGCCTQSSSADFADD